MAPWWTSNGSAEEQEHEVPPTEARGSKGPDSGQRVVREGGGAPTAVSAAARGSRGPMAANAAVRKSRGPNVDQRGGAKEQAWRALAVWRGWRCQRESKRKEKSPSRNLL